MTRTTKEIRKMVEDSGYKLLYEYSEEKNRMKRVIIQDSDGYKYELYFHDFIKGGVLNFVDRRNPFTLLNVSVWLKKENKPFLLCDNNIYMGNSEKLFFKCLMENCQEIFDMNWNNIYSGHKCPFCAGRRVGKHNNLEYLRPDLAEEWDFENNKNNPKDYTEFSKERVSWICSECGNTWKAKIGDRSHGSDCPKCSDSKKESTIAKELKMHFKENYNAIPEYKILKNPNTGRWLPYDLYIPYGEKTELNGFYIEVHWEHHYKVCFWHKKLAERKEISPEEELKYQKHKDKIKKVFANKNGIYIDIDLRKIKTTEEAIKHVEKVLERTLE